MPIYSLSATQKANWDGDYIFGCSGLDKSTRTAVKKRLNQNDIDYTFNKNGWVFSKDQLADVEECLKEYLKKNTTPPSSPTPTSRSRNRQNNNNNNQALKKRISELQKAFDKVQSALDDCYDKLDELTKN